MTDCNSVYVGSIPTTLSKVNLKSTYCLGVAQSGQSIAFGKQKSLVRIQSSRQYVFEVP